MKIILGDKQYYVNEKRIVDYYRSKIDPIFGKKITLPNGRVIDLNKRSILSTAIRQIAVTMILPLIEIAAKTLDVSIPPLEKHGDVIEYILDNYYLLFIRSCEQSEVVLEASYYVDDIQEIVSATFQKEENKPIPMLFLPSVEHVREERVNPTED